MQKQKSMVRTWPFTSGSVKLAMAVMADGDDVDYDDDDVSESVKTEEVGASVKVENLDNMEVEQDVKKEQMNETEEAKGWLTISSLPIGWKFREMSSPEAAGKVEFSTNKRQFFLAPTGKIFPSRCFHRAD